MAEVHLGTGRVWIAPLGTELDGPGWTEIGHVIDDGLVFVDPAPPAVMLVANGTSLALTLTCPSTPFGWWRPYRELLGETHPQASRVKREYHRRRR